MKKCVLAILLGSVLVGGAFAQAGSSYGGNAGKKPALATESLDFFVNFFSEKMNGKSYSELAFGVNNNYFRFAQNAIIGPYYNLAIGVLSERKKEGSKVDIEYGAEFDFIFGPGFRIPISEQMRVTAGLGVHTSSNFYDFRDVIVGLGVGGTIAYNVSISEDVMFNIGANVAYDFVGYDIDRGSLNNYSAVEIKPFIGLAFK
ncbi:MAG: hypothetical protein Ta2A_09580 [Treponemataceae bacterium]|nr:MAG: hypothetical protein Ta2A_09580 [Treponemataceae bacterium]